MDSRRMLCCFLSVIGILFTTLLVVSNSPKQLAYIEARTVMIDEEITQHAEPLQAAYVPEQVQETLPVIYDTVDWVVSEEGIDENLKAIEETVVAYYRLLINSFACGELVEELCVLDLTEIQMQNVHRYLDNKLLFMDVMKTHGTVEYFTWHNPLVKIDQHLLGSEDAEVLIDLSLSNFVEEDRLPELVQLGKNSFRLRLVDGIWKIYDIDLETKQQGINYLDRDQLIEIWSRDNVEDMFRALNLVTPKESVKVTK